jgi:hypothetical protein
MSTTHVVLEFVHIRLARGDYDPAPLVFLVEIPLSRKDIYMDDENQKSNDLQDPAEPYRVDQEIETSGQPVEVETETSGQDADVNVTTTVETDAPDDSE